MNDIIDIGLESFDVPKPSASGSTSGGGLEFLMNMGSGGSSSASPKAGSGSMGLGDLRQLETELNDLADSKPISLETVDIGLGSASASSLNQTTARTWDGFTKMNDIPVEPTKVNVLTDREKSKKKRIMLKRLEEWQKKGLIGSHGASFNMDSSYDDIEDEYETVMEDKRKQESIKLQKHWFLTGINTLEFFNSMINPFDLDLTGWGEKMSEDMDDDDEVFAELYEKYKGGKLAPEVALILRVATSAFLINMTNKMVSAATPGLSDVFRQSPDLMNAFMKATVDSLNQAGPGQGQGSPLGSPTGGNSFAPGAGGGQANPLAAFAKDMFSQEFKPKTTAGPPPPVESKKMAAPPRPGAAGSSMQFTMSRPDLNAATNGTGGVEINQGFSSFQERTPLQTQPISQFSPPPVPTGNTGLRPEMKGPSTTDLDSLLAGLKRKEVESEVNQAIEISLSGPTAPAPLQRGFADDEISIISSGDIETGTGYKKRGRKPKNNRSERSITIDL
jgi:hypothetical protein